MDLWSQTGRRNPVADLGRRRFSRWVLQLLQPDGSSVGRGTRLFNDPKKAAYSGVRSSLFRCLCVPSLPAEKRAASHLLFSHRRSPERPPQTKRLDSESGAPDP